MTDYISREAAFKEFAKFVRGSNNSDFLDAPTWNDAVSLIGSLHAADVVEVVRCRECVFFDGTKPGQPNILCFQMHENDFCSYGERKDGAT